MANPLSTMTVLQLLAEPWTQGNKVDHNFLNFGQAENNTWDNNDKENSNDEVIVQTEEVDANLPLNIKMSAINARKHIVGF